VNTRSSAVSIGSADRSLAHQIYFALRQRIIEGQLPAGTWLRERELAEEFSVSRIPLREALPQLEADGFIITHPRRGAVVRQLTLRDAVEYFDLRSSLEVLVARLAAQRVRQGASTVELLESVRLADEAMLTGDDQAIAQANSAIHDALVELAGNRLLASALKPIGGLQLWFFGVTTERDQHSLKSEHHSIVDAVVEGSVELAASLAFSHVERSRHESLPLLAERLPPE
jgi:DNA-binding GntR family transcriptional regulator